MLKVHTRTSGDVTILRLRGRISIGETTPLRNAVLSQSSVSIVVLDLPVLLELTHTVWEFCWSYVRGLNQKEWSSG